MNDLRLYAGNWGIWFKAFRQIWFVFRRDDLGILWLVKFGCYWFVDVGLNTASGGDPRESVSSRVYKDRHDSVIARLIWRVLDWIEDGHGLRVVNLVYGEDTRNNRELSRIGQAVAIVLTLTVIGAVFWWVFA